MHAALANPAGATVAQGNSDANVIIDTDGFLHATASIHADDSIKVRAKRGALFETTTYDAMAITQNETATTSRSGPFGMDSDTVYHRLTEWHKVKVAQEPMLATTTRGDFVIVLPDDKETAEFKGMFADIAGNFEVHSGNCVLSPLEVARVEKCPGLFGGEANRISTMLPVFLKTVLKSNKDFLADVRVFKNTAGKIEALGDIVINATDRIEFNTETRKFTLAEGMEVDEGTFTTKVSSRKVEDVIFGQPEAKAGGDIKFNSDSVHMTGSYESEGDIEISARLATLESVLGYGTDGFCSRASNMFSNASYSRFATFARVAPTVFRAHGDFIADIIGLYAEHSVQKSCRNERVTAGSTDSSALRAKETVIEHSSSSGFNFFVPTSVVAPVCDGNIRQTIDAFWRESSLLSSSCSLLHSRRGADIAANGISTALAAYSSIKTILDFGVGGFASLFGVGDIGYYHIESSQNTTHEFTVGSTTTASGNIEWRARTGDIKITHRLAEAGENQSYTAAGRIEVNPGEDVVKTDGHTTSCNGTFNVFTGGVSLGVSGGPSNSSSVEYLASGFKSRGTNVFRAGNGINIVIPQIEGTRNVFDAMLVCLENKANEQEVHSESYGATISTDPLEALALTTGANFGVEDSHDTYLNDAYVRGAVDFMHSRVRNQGCVVMNIENAGASYEYVPGHEVHDSTSFAIGLSGLDLTSADGFAYSLGRSLASSATSMGVGMMASKAGLGGFVSTIAASLAGTYVNMELSPGKNQTSTEQDKKPKLPSISSNSTVSYEHNGRGFRAVNIDFGEREFAAVINKIRENIFSEALDKGLSTEQAVRQAHETVEQFTQEVETEQTKIDATAGQIETTENSLRDEVRETVGEEAVQKLAEGKKLSSQDNEQVSGSLSKAIEKLERYQTELNLRAPLEQSEPQQASLQAQNELIGEKIQQYQALKAFLDQNIKPRLTRSNSSDNLLQDTFIRQGQRAFSTVAGAFSNLAQEADSMSHRDYVELQRSRLPAEMQNNPEVLAKLAAEQVFYKGFAQIGHGLSALDDATGNIVSGAMHKLGEGFEWIGTHTRRFVRDDLGLGQRVGQNVGDATQIAAEIFLPGTVVKGVGSTSKLIGASRFRTALGERLGLYKGDVSAAKIGLRWGDPILGERGYGMVFENYVATLPGFNEIRLPKNFKTFDFWDKISGRAVSVKTLDTNKTTYILKPSEVYGRIKGYIDETLEFTKYGKGLEKPITTADITHREIQLGIPANTGAAQMRQIQRAVEYGRLNNVGVVITRIGK